jgi:hypothetical protein
MSFENVCATPIISHFLLRHTKMHTLIICNLYVRFMGSDEKIIKIKLIHQINPLHKDVAVMNMTW